MLMTNDLNTLEKQTLVWFDEKGLSDPVMQFAKLNEEVGEMAHELTRGRYDSPEIMDSVGDVMITLIGMCHHLNLPLGECWASALNEIQHRKGKVIDGSFVKDPEA